MERLACRALSVKAYTEPRAELGPGIHVQVHHLSFPQDLQPEDPVRGEQLLGLDEAADRMVIS